MTKFRLFGRQTDEVSERELSHRQLAREVAAEGMVLLKNEGVLPLQNKKIALFGAGARMTVKGGTGSGNMQERYSVSIEEGLKNAGFTLASTRWMDRFDAAFAAEKEAWRLSIEARIKGYKPWEVQRMFDEVIHVTPLRFPIGDEIQQEDLPEDTDTAIYVIARQAGESTDRRLEKGDYYLADVEEANIRTLAEHYEKVLLVINCGGILDLSILDEVPGIGAVLHFVQGGEEGGNAFADIVSGKVTPSGKLTDTWAIDYYDYPCAEEFGILGDVLQQNYREGIYVGYRWFDANKIEPRWPFGFGLSYADFEITVQNTQIVGTMVTVTACVRNISSCYSGKDVVQLYLAKPEGKLHKEHKALAAFRKTGLLAPGQEEICTLQVDLQECASYDEETACKLLEQGEYGVFIGSDSRKNALCAVLTLEKTVVTEKLTNILPISKEFELFVPQTKALVYPAEVQHLTIQMGAFAKKGIHYDAPIPVIKTKQTGEYLKTLSDKELIELCVGAGFNGLGYNVTPTTVGRTSINLLKKGIPNVNFSDGPAGLNLCPKNAYTKFGVPNYVDELPQDWQWGWIRKIEPFVLAKPGKGYRVYQYMTCFPAATLQAQTWNPSLIEEVGHAIGTEMIEAGVTLWLAPGLNIHRNPLCGRNFEYYSEDPYVSGVMAASVTRGVQSHPGLGVTIKHFCCNNQEDKRETVSENVPERALREIYLRGFEIAVRKSKPWAVMTSYKYGLLLTLLALFLASVTDEISSAIGVQVQSSVVTEFFVRPLNVPYNEAMAMFSTATTFSYALMALVPFYKALADKFGRKPFLVLNTLGMGVGMALAWWSPNMVLYFIGYGMTVFFVQHDMQIVYLYEIVPKERRATIYGLIKGISTLGVVLIPMLRSSVMGTDTTLWRGVYFLPALIAIAVSVFSLVVTRESKTFLDQRISYLESPYELRHPEVKKLSREEEKAQKAEVKQHKTGVFHALGHLFKNKQLFWLAMASSAFALGSTTISGFSESIMTDFGMTSEAVNEALLIYPFLYAALIVGAGFVGDKLGRKTIVSVCGALAVGGFIGFNISAWQGASPYLVGIFYGLYLGCWWITLDYVGMMVAESAPTYNRGSVLGAVNLVTMVGSGIGSVVPIFAVLLFERIGFGYMTAVMPFAFIGVLLLIFKVKETRGVDLDKVTY